MINRYPSSIRSLIATLVWIAGLAQVAPAQEIFLGGKEFQLSVERSSAQRELQVYYPFGSNERDWTERVEIHHYPDLQQPRRVVLVVLERLRESFPNITYKILPGASNVEAGVSYLAATEGDTEVRLEFLLYKATGEADGLMAYRFTYRSSGPDARYSRSLLRGKWDYYERAFLEMNWPQSLESVGELSMPAVFKMGEQSFGKSIAEVKTVESRSLTIRPPEGRVLTINQEFLENQDVETRIPFFLFTTPRDTSNLFIEYQGQGIPEILKLSLAGPEMQLVENLRVFPFLLPAAKGNERLWQTAGKLRRKIEEEYLNGWKDVRITEPFFTQIGPVDGFVCLTSFADSEGNRMFARFTLFLPNVGDRALLAFSQVDPRYSSVKRMEDLESGGVMAGVAHSIRFMDPGTRIVETEPPIEEVTMPVEAEPIRSLNPLPYEPITEPRATD